MYNTPCFQVADKVFCIVLRATTMLLRYHYLIFAMSSNNASSIVTYMSVSSDSNGPSSWGIPLDNAGEILDMDPYEEVAQQGQAYPLSPAYVPDPNLAEDQPYAKDASPTTESPGYIADSDLMEDDTDVDSIAYLDESGTDDEDEDPEEDPSEEHDPEDKDEDPEEDPSEEHEPENEDAKEDESSEDSDETKPFEENETAATPPPPRSPQTRIPFSQTCLCRARNTIKLEPPMPTSMEAHIVEHAAAPIPPTSPTYDQAPLGHMAAMICIRDDIPESDSATVGGEFYDFVDTVKAGQGLIRSPGHDARTIARAADRAEDVGYVRSLQAFEHRMMTSIKEVNLRVSYQAQVHRKESEDFYTQLLDARTDGRDIRLEIDVVRGQRTSYEIELHKGANDAMTPESIQAMIDQAIQRNST
ncbi:hypothetical protein Tco_1182951 [Tanacetum coccineum]